MHPLPTFPPLLAPRPHAQQLGSGYWTTRAPGIPGDWKGEREGIQKGEMHKIGLYAGPHAKIMENILVILVNIPKCAESSVMVLSRQI